MPSAPASSPASSSAIIGVELGRGRRAVRHAHHHQARACCGRPACRRSPRSPESVEILRETSVSRNGVHGARRRQIILQQFDLAGQRRRDREAAMADDLGGDALADLALGLGIDRQREVGMGLDVDEARRDRETGGVDGLAPARSPIAGRSPAMRPSSMARSPARRRCRCRRTEARRGSGCHGSWDSRIKRRPGEQPGQHAVDGAPSKRGDKQ